MKSTDNKRKFLHTECWLLSVSAAFQRGNVYSFEVTNAQKKMFRKMLRITIMSDLVPAYKSEDVSSDNHISNIQLLCDKATSQFAGILNGGEFRFGTAQKLLNLYLKYLWCLGELKTPPPHFPVDRRIQSKLKMEITPWTMIKSAEEYMAIVNAAEALLAPRFKTLADMELELFGRSEDED